jgi:hypothetical protein
MEGEDNCASGQARGVTRMRFSDMMGSGNDRSAPSETDIVVADALAPYLEAVTQAPVLEPTAMPEIACAPDDAPPADEITEITPVGQVESGEPEPVAPLKSVASVFAARLAVPPAPSPSEAPVAEPVAAAFADFTPLSDDLLPRRR